MSGDEIRKLLGGYATGTLTQAEQEALFAAALEDQELFEDLVREQPVRDLLRDPAAKAELLAALDSGEKRAWWKWRPLIAGVAMAGMAAVAVVAWRGSPGSKPVPTMIAELKVQELAPARGAQTEESARPVAAPGAPAKRRAKEAQPTTEQPEKDVVASSGKLTSAVAEPQATPAPAAPPPVVKQESAAIDNAKPLDRVQPSPVLPFRADS